MNQIEKLLQLSPVIFFLFLAAQIPSNVLAQSRNISGVVHDEKGQPIANALVKTWPGSITTSTDGNGLFSMGGVTTDTSVFVYAIKDGYFTGCSPLPETRDTLNILVSEIPTHLDKISPYLFGSNYWKPYHPDLGFFKDQIRDAAINTVRLGGHSFDGAGRNWDERAIDSLVTFCHSISAQPVVQAQLFGGSPQKSADMVHYANIENDYGIKFWSVGNEPDLYNIQGQGPYEVQDYIRDFRAYYHAMKSVDPSIVVAGPELSWNYDIDNSDNWLTPFLEACGDIVNIITFHRYPFFGAQTIDETLQDPPLIEALIDEIRLEVLRITGRRIPIALTETNLNWQWTGTGDGYGDSFYAGLWWGETLGRLIKKGMLMANFWTLVDDGPLSMFASDDGIYAPRRPRPTYFVHYLFGGFYRHYLSSHSNNSDVVNFVSQDSTGRMILISINKSRVQDYKAKFSFSSQITEPQLDIFLKLPKLSMVRADLGQSGIISKIKLYSIREFESDAPPIDADSLNLGFTSKIDVVVNVPDDYVTSSKEDPASARLPTTYHVSESYPNPFYGQAAVDYRVGSGIDSRVNITVFDVRGRAVRVLVNRLQPSGHYRAAWNGLDSSGRDVPNGIYFFAVKIDGRLVSAMKSIKLR